MNMVESHLKVRIASTSNNEEAAKSLKINLFSDLYQLKYEQLFNGQYRSQSIHFYGVLQY